MPERGFDTGYWTDPFVRKLNAYGKLLYSYLWTNDHCNQAGVYELDLETMAFETKLPEAGLPNLLHSLEPKVKWFPDLDIIWVKNFVARQSKSPKFLIAAAKCLKRLNNNGIAKEVVAYNLEHHSISIPYPYTIDSVSIPSVSASRSSSSSKSDKGKGVVRGKGELSSEEKSIIKSLGQLKGWQADEDDVLWLQGLEIEIPGLTLADFKACIDYHSGRAPPKHKGIWKNRFRNWMIKKQEFEEGREKHGKRKEQPSQGPKRPATHRRDDKEPSAERYRQSLE